MTGEEGMSKRSRILLGIYSSSMGISLTALSIVAALEVFMLGYSVVNAPMYGEYLWNYRAFYIALLTVALIYIGLNFFVKKDIEHRFKVLNVANPIYAAFFFAWALGITFFDAMIWGTVDSMVFMTFSLVVPLSFYLFPTIYAAIVVVADALMLYLVVTVSGSIAPLTNLSIFCIFQIVLGVSFLHLRRNLAERMVEEEENAELDVLTGFANRRVYEADVKGLGQETVPPDLTYVSIDLNGLKDVNDHYGHEAGDRLIIGAAQCVEQCFGQKGKMYRIGGDEFVVLISAGQEELDGLFSVFDKSVQSWSENSNLTLSTAYGYARHSEYPDDDPSKLAKVADERMYVAKARYYQESGHDRRRYAV